ncbi:MAG TPA: hypothetical protein VFE27_17420 [Acidobacteriaceae bacterium]|jgi:hypothetical protein|nr:hypothetical protein [Acidobacteriaceae bacterium]
MPLTAARRAPVAISSYPGLRLTVIHLNCSRWIPGSDTELGYRTTYDRIRPYNAPLSNPRTRQDRYTISYPYVIFDDYFCITGERPVGRHFKRATLHPPSIDPVVVVSNNDATPHQHIIANPHKVRRGNVHTIAESHIVPNNQ